MGGSATKDETSSKPPQWWEDAAKKALAAGEKVSRIGYVPYQGPDVAAFSPQMIDAMQQAEDWSAAFMRPGEAPRDISADIMPATDFGGGLRGYSSYGGFIDSIEALKGSYPGLYKYLSGFFIDPVTGKYPGTGDPGLPGGDPTNPPPVSPPPVSPPPPPGPGTGGGGWTNVPGGGPPPRDQWVPGMRGTMPNGNIWKINQNGQLVIIDRTPNQMGGEGGKGNWAARADRNIQGGTGPVNLGGGSFP